jgi:hypothetical protein
LEPHSTDESVSCARPVQTALKQNFTKVYKPFDLDQLPQRQINYAQVVVIGKKLTFIARNIRKSLTYGITKSLTAHQGTSLPEPTARQTKTL